MPGTITLGDKTYPFDEEIFAEHWLDEPDLVTNAMLTSGALAEDAYIGSLISTGSNVYTIPFYGLLPDDADDNYDGQNDITLTTMGASHQTGVVYGRMHGFYADQFVQDFTTAHPMAAIAARTAKYWQNKAHARIIGITDAVLSLSAMSDHVVTVDELTPNTLSEATQKVFGANKGQIRLAIMHSAVAQVFENMQRVDYLKHTDANGVTRELDVYQVNGITVIIDDGVPATAASGDDKAKYTTYLFAEGALRHASAPVTMPVELGRDPKTRGGVDELYMRFRETYHPNGFSFALPTTGTGANKKPVVSPTDEQLGTAANWSLAYGDHKAIPFMKLVSPGVA